MSELPPRSPLARFAGPVGHAAWHSNTLALQERPTPGLLRLQLLDDDTDARNAIAAALGITLPDPGQIARSAGLRCAWVAEKEWLWFCAPGEEARLADALARAGGTQAISTVITDSRVCVRVQGECARRVFAKGSGLDFHPTAFAPGRCTITRLAQITVMIEQDEDASAFDLYGDRSQAVYLWNWLLDAAAEFGSATA